VSEALLVAAISGIIAIIGIALKLLYDQKAIHVLVNSNMSAARKDIAKLQLLVIAIVLAVAGWVWKSDRDKGRK